MKSQSDAAATPAEGSLVLSPIVGPPHAPLTILAPADGRELIFGRGSDVHIRVNDPYRSVSREHAKFKYAARRWLVCDVSTAGTQVSGRRLVQGMWTELTSGDELAVGGFVFLVKQVGEQPTTMVTAPDHPMAHTLTVMPPPKPEAIARGQLEVLLEASKAMHDAAGPAEIATVMLRACIQATGYGRISLLAASGDEVEVLATESRNAGAPRPGTSRFPQVGGQGARSASSPFSRTLVAQAARGQTVQFAAGETGMMTQTGSESPVVCALCIPVKVGSTVERLLYLDSTAPVPALPAAAAFAQCVADIAGSVLSSIAASELRQDQQRQRGQMEAAHDIQMAALPSMTGGFEGIGYNYRIIPARDVAGDLFGVQPLGPHTTAVWFGDVSGKGVPAALLGVMAHAFLSAALREGEPEVVLAEAMARLDGFLRARCADDRFISLFCGIIDQQRDCLWYIDAGHGFWLSKSAAGWSKGEATETVLRLAQPPFVPARLEFGPDAALVLLSDGVVEQTGYGAGGGSGGVQFGFERLIGIAEQATNITDIPQAVVSAVRVFAGARKTATGFTKAGQEVAKAEDGGAGGGPGTFDDDLSVASVWRAKISGVYTGN